MKRTLIFMLLCFAVATTAISAQGSDKKGKLISFTQGGVLLGSSHNAKKAPFILGTLLNYGITRDLSAGVGVGVELLNETYLPVTANFLYQYRRGPIVPFVMMQGGYQIALEDPVYDGSYWPVLPGSSYYPSLTPTESKGGMMLQPSIGVIYYTKAGIGFSIAAGYRYQKLKYTGENDYKLDAKYNRLSLLFGFIF